MTKTAGPVDRMCTGNGEKLSSSQVEPGQTIISDVA